MTIEETIKQNLKEYLIAMDLPTHLEINTRSGIAYFNFDIRNGNIEFGYVHRIPLDDPEAFEKTAQLIQRYKNKRTLCSRYLTKIEYDTGL